MMKIDMEKPGKAVGAQSLNRALDILDQIVLGPSFASHLSRKVGLSHSTTNRLLGALEARDYVSRTSGGFTLGSRILAMGAAAAARLDYVKIARPFMEALNITSQCTVLLSQREGLWVSHLDRIDGTHRLQIAATVGERLPILSSGLGRALLVDEREDDRGLKAGRLEEAVIEREMASSLICRTHSPDNVTSIAAPVRNSDGLVRLAVGIEGAAFNLPEQMWPFLSDQVTHAAEQISAALGYAP